MKHSKIKSTTDKATSIVINSVFGSVMVKLFGYIIMLVRQPFGRTPILPFILMSDIVNQARRVFENGNYI